MRRASALVRVRPGSDEAPPRTTRRRPRPKRARRARTRRPTNVRTLHPRPSGGPRRGRVATFGRALTALGILSLGFGVFQARIGDLSERRAQRESRSALTQIIESGGGLGRDAQGNVGPIERGSPVALLDIPRLGVHKVVVDGASSEELKRGPGLLSSSPLPGQPGHTIIVGRRTTYGSPFRHLEVLAKGDRFTTTTPFGRFTYRVREVKTLEPGAVTNLKETQGSLLTLVTSDPPYVGGKALAVVSTLSGKASTFPDPPRRASAVPGAIDFGGTSGGFVGAAVSGLLLLAALVVSDVLYLRWRRWSTYVLTTPIILALAYAWMQSLSSALPASL